MCEIGSEFDIDSNGGYMDISETASFLTSAEFFRSGRDALKAIAKKYKGLYKRILIPALCCESMVIPFQVNGYEVSFYKLNPNFTANTEDIFSKLQPTNLFLYMNYFGIQSLSDEILQLINQCFQSTIMIEDRTHDILSPRCNSFTPNFTICSIRKWLAIPDGGVLYSKGNKLNIRTEYDAYFSEIRIKALKNKSNYLKFGDSKLKALFRQQLADANAYLENDKSIVSMSEKSYELLKNINFYKIYEVRKKNIETLHLRLMKLNNVKQIKELNIERVGLYYPVIFDDRDRVQRELAENAVFCPVIWPLPQSAKGICEISDYISNHMLALPCDQRYDESGMEYIVRMLKSVNDR
jgi:hypothetical protein